VKEAIRSKAEADAVTVAAIRGAATNLSRFLRTTPLQHSPAFSDRTGAEVHLKIEGIQPVRAFKVRGALNKISRLGPVERGRGVVTASAGNHGLGVAYAASAWKIPATVYVALNANPLKVDAIRRLGAHVVSAGSNYNEAYMAAQSAQGSQIFIHAYDDPDVIAGQGTVGVELYQDLPEVDTILVPVGGGGLIAGVALYMKQMRPSVKVVGIEPTGAACLNASLAADKVVNLSQVSTIADGLAASEPGVLGFEIARKYVDDMILVEETEMLESIRLCFEWEHLLVEPAGAAAMAALLHHYSPRPGEKVAVILSGANITEEVLLNALAS
jgi:threonine dehydratase